MSGYVELVRGLPVPTVEQTERFVDFVAHAHSWYKHLPAWPPGLPFTFFLDPNAGRDFVHLPGGESGYVDRTDEVQACHYTWMVTTEYRARFGHWQYHADAGPGLFVGSAGRGWTDLNSRAVVLSEEGEWLSAPPPYAAECPLTGLVHKRFNLIFVQDRFRREHAAFVAGGSDADRLRYTPLLRAMEREEVGRSADLDAFLDAERARLRAAMRDTLMRVREAVDRIPRA